MSNISGQPDILEIDISGQPDILEIDIMSNILCLG